MIRVGVIGAGAMGRNHVRVLNRLEDAVLVGVHDLDLARAESVSSEFGTKSITMEELLAGSDAVTIAAPTRFHRDLGVMLLSAGKHIFMEKPITATVEEARELIGKAKETGRTLAVGHIERFNPVIAELERRLTHPKFIEAHRLSPFPGRSVDIGVVLDLMIHDLEIILHLVNSPVASVDAAGVSVLTPHEDIANARIRFENGCVANITTSRISPERLRKLRVFQSDAYLSLDYMNQKGEIYFKGPAGIERADLPVEPQEPLMLELNSFLESVSSGKPPRVGGSAAANALELALRITDLIRAGR
jgi:predicted dehydrogenase